MVKWKKMNKKMAGLLLGVMMLFTASTTAFAYVDESAEASKVETRSRNYFRTSRRDRGKSTKSYTVFERRSSKTGWSRSFVSGRRRNGGNHTHRMQRLEAKI